MGWVACTLAGKWLLLPVAIVTTFVSVGCSYADLVAERPMRRSRAIDAEPCCACLRMADKCMALEQDRDELREALATLQIDGRRP